jgi:hypothetical protein
MAKSVACLLCIALPLFARAQETEMPRLFSTEVPLKIRLHFAIKEVKSTPSDTIFSHTQIQVNTTETWQTIPVEVRARGNFRRANCFFPPLRLHFSKKDIANTVFKGNRSLKLVLPCQKSNAYNTLIDKEYLIYKMYEHLSPYYFHTRLADIELTDDREAKSKSYMVHGFFIEDDDEVADRHHGKIIEPIDHRIHPLQLSDTAAVVQDLFQYMISNTDWSTVMQHNNKVMQLNNGKYIPLAYDFDMSGFVDAPYATVSETIGTSDVTERVYRGFCHPEPVFEYVRQHYLNEEKNLMDLISAHSAILGEPESKRLKNYLSLFFDTLRSDRAFKSEIVSKCRKG